MEKEPTKVSSVPLTDFESKVLAFISLWKDNHQGPPSSKTLAKEFQLSRNKIDKVRRSIQVKRGSRPGSI